MLAGDARQPRPRRVRHRRARRGAAHAAGALVAVDNTTATPLGQRPLELGADLTLASDTKALAGHDDVVLGHVSRRDPALAARLRELRTRAAPGPARWRPGSPTAGSPRSTCAWPGRPPTPPRSSRCCAAHPAVATWRWPGHPDDPAHDLARGRCAGGTA